MRASGPMPVCCAVLLSQHGESGVGMKRRAKALPPLWLLHDGFSTTVIEVLSGYLDPQQLP
jgi:hypothetical protein